VDVVVHRDVDADYNRPRFWHSFAYGTCFRALPVGCVSVMLGGVPYYYNNGETGGETGRNRVTH